MDDSTTVVVKGKEWRTLRDILPKEPGLRVLFIGKAPAPKSVEAGHYFQGRQGKAFWRMLKEYGLLMPKTEHEDDSLLDHGFGMTDITKLPRDYGNEPTPAEYRSGIGRVLQLIELHKPEVLIFIYKAVLDKGLKLRWGMDRSTRYGFNPGLDALLGARVFVFPIPGTPCTRAEADTAMRELAALLADGGTMPAAARAPGSR